MNKNDSKKQVREAIHACQDKKAEEITILELDKDSGAFTDYFVVCSGTNPRQVQAIADEVETRLEKGHARESHGGLQAGGVGAAGLCGFCGACVFRKGSEVL